MRVNDDLTVNYSYQRADSHNSSENFTFGMSGAITKIDGGEEDGEFLGLTMIPEEGRSVMYGMRAMLPAKSTVDNPIVQIVSNLDGNREVFDIEIKKINPQHASRMEMFALCSYADKVGLGTGSTFGTFQTFRIYEDTARENGLTKRVDESISAWEQFKTEKVDWMSLCKSVLDILKTINDPKVMDLINKGNRLINLYSKCLSK